MLHGLAPSVPIRIPPTMAYVGGASTGSDQSTYTFNSMTLGDKDADGRRWTVLCAGAYKEDSNVTMSTVTIGGIAADIVIKNTTDGRTAVAIAIADTSSLGTTATGVVNLSTSANGAALVLYRMYDIADPVPFSTNTGLETAGKITLDTNIAVPGCTVAVSMVRNPTLSSHTWSGLTENADADVDSNDYFSVASGGVVGSPAAIFVQCADTTPDSMRACVASWR